MTDYVNQGYPFHESYNIIPIEEAIDDGVYFGAKLVDGLWKPCCAENSGGPTPHWRVRKYENPRYQPEFVVPASWCGERPSGVEVGIFNGEKRVFLPWHSSALEPGDRVTAMRPSRLVDKYCYCEIWHYEPIPELENVSIDQALIDMCNTIHPWKWMVHSPKPVLRMHLIDDHTCEYNLPTACEKDS